MRREYQMTSVHADFVSMKQCGVSVSNKERNGGWIDMHTTKR